MKREKKVEGAAHRNTQTKVAVRCTLNYANSIILLQILRCAAPIKSLFALVIIIHFIGGCQQPKKEEIASKNVENKQIMKKNPVVSFEIPVTNMSRAIGFYQTVFGFDFEKKDIDGNEMAYFPIDDKAHGISGSLAKGDSYTPSKNGSRLYFNVDNIDETLKKVVQNKGKILYPKTDIGEWGFVAEFEDLEGNRIALSMPK